MNNRINTQKQTNANKRGGTLAGITRKKVRLVVILSFMMAVFLASFLPFSVGRLLYDAGLLKDLSASRQYNLIASCHIVYKSSSLINPLLTLSLKDDYGNLLVKYFTRSKSTKQSQKERLLK